MKRCADPTLDTHTPLFQGVWVSICVWSMFFDRKITSSDLGLYILIGATDGEDGSEFGNEELAEVLKTNARGVEEQITKLIGLDLLRSEHGAGGRRLWVKMETREYRGCPR